MWNESMTQLKLDGGVLKEGMKIKVVLWVVYLISVCGHDNYYTYLHLNKIHLLLKKKSLVSSD